MCIPTFGKKDMLLIFDPTDALALASPLLLFTKALSFFSALDLLRAELQSINACASLFFWLLLKSLFPFNWR